MPAKKQKQQPNQTSYSDDITITGSDYSNMNSILIGSSNVDYIDMSVTTPNYTVSTDLGTLTTGSSYTWAQEYSIAGSNGYSSNVNINGDGITMKPDSDIKLGDRSLKEFMERVDEHLAILHPSPELEERWGQLKELRQQYESLKQEILEKEKMWDLLKK
jgi:hypothetical protein